MGGGGGNNPLSDVGNAISNGTKAIGSFYGFNSSTGQWDNSGGVFHALDEGVGEVTGRNESRAALNQATDQYNQAQTDANNLVAQQQWNQMTGDMQSSQTASAARSAAASTGPTYGSTTPLGWGASGNPGAQKDFLGL